MLSFLYFLSTEPGRPHAKLLVTGDPRPRLEQDEYNTRQRPEDCHRREIVVCHRDTCQTHPRGSHCCRLAGDSSPAGHRGPPANPYRRRPPPSPAQNAGRRYCVRSQAQHQLRPTQARRVADHVDRALADPGRRSPAWHDLCRERVPRTRTRRRLPRSLHGGDHAALHTLNPCDRPPRTTRFPRTLSLQRIPLWTPRERRPGLRKVRHRQQEHQQRSRDLRRLRPHDPDGRSHLWPLYFVERIRGHSSRILCHGRHRQAADRRHG